MSLSRASFLTAMTLALMGCASARAELMRSYVLSGQVSSVDDDGSLLGGQVKAGDPFTATMIIDPGVPDTVEGASEGKYSFRLGTNTGLSMSVGGLQFGGDAATGPLAVRVFDRSPGNPDGDVISGYQFGDSTFEGAILSRLEFGFVDPTGTALSGDAIPAGIDLTKFATSYLNTSVFFDPSSRAASVGIAARIDSISVQSVPEPTAVMTMGVLAAGLWYRHRRRAAA